MNNDPTVRAAHAKRILEDDVFKSAISAMEAKAIDKWRSSNPDQMEEREDAYRMLRVIGDFRAEFQSMINDGVSAKRRDERKT